MRIVGVFSPTRHGPAIVRVLIITSLDVLAGNRVTDVFDLGEIIVSGDVAIPGGLVICVCGDAVKPKGKSA